MENNGEKGEVILLHTANVTHRTKLSENEKAEFLTGSNRYTFLLLVPIESYEN